MADTLLCVSHASALHYWRTNPPEYVLEGADQNIRSIAKTPSTVAGFRSFALSEAEFGPEPIDILVPESIPYCPAEFRRHIQVAKLPPHALYPLRDGIHIVSPELCFVQLCGSLPFVEALETGMELCGMYARREFSDEGMASRDYRLIDAQALRRRLEQWHDLKGLVEARRVARFLESGSASPMESKVYLLLCLPQRYGGYNLPHPELNPEVLLTQEGSLLLRQEKVYPDMLWRKSKLVLEYDGGYHRLEDQPLRDEMRASVLESMGYTVLRVKKEQAKNALAFDGVAHAVARHLKKRIRPLSLSQEHAREELRSKLFLPQKGTEYE
ncbi:MAG: DUF559 domain-containing protein [Coriobacteriia bacterium]|nr:DUF559 domain-containing protein [Coriobacteriia bacterium]